MRNRWMLRASTIAAMSAGVGAAAIAQNTNDGSQLSPGATRSQPLEQKPDAQGTRAQDARRTATNDFAMPTRWQKATDLMGKSVTNASNEDLGKIEDIVVDAQSGRILYGVLSFGGFLGMGDKLFAIPWQSLQLPADAKKLVLNVSKDRLKTAEGFDKKNWPNFADETWNTNTYKYYEHTPYWQASDTTRDGAANPTQGGVSDTNREGIPVHRQRWYQRVTVWQKASDLCGKDIHNHENADLGKISDLVIDPDGGRVLYGVLSHGSKLIAIPFSALTLSSDGKRFVVNMTAEQAKNMAGFQKDAWPTFTDSRWATETHSQFNVPPYWVEVETRRTDNR